MHLVTFGAKDGARTTQMVNFLVVDKLLAYNTISGKLTVNKL